MYNIQYIGVPEKQSDLDAIFALLCLCDNDFVPPLSQRTSPTQKDLSGGKPADGKPYAYFETMRSQHFIVAYDENGYMAAFLTFRPNYVCEHLGEYSGNNYMTTACVDPAHRGKGLVTQFYDYVEYKLPDSVRTDFITTRTWSTNAAQMHTFPKRGYVPVATLKDDRGPGVDTVYFVKNCRQS